MKINRDYEYEKFGGLITLRHLGDEFGINYDKLVERLEKGSSLYMALNVPGNLEMEVRQYPKRGTHYILSQQVFRGSEKDLKKWLSK